MNTQVPPMNPEPNLPPIVRARMLEHNRGIAGIGVGQEFLVTYDAKLAQENKVYFLQERRIQSCFDGRYWERLEMNPAPVAREQGKLDPLRDRLGRSNQLTDLGFTPRQLADLSRQDITTLADIAAFTKEAFSEIDGVGPGLMSKVEEIFIERGINFQGLEPEE